MDYKQLKELLFRHECKHPETHLTACVTFASFGPGNKKDYPWNSRTYVISSDNKAFQPGKSGYSIFGRCLDGTDPCLRMEGLMAAERGGKDGWVVEDCGIAGYLLIECSDCNISAPKLFYSYKEALECMLSRLAEVGELDAGQLKRDYAAARELFEEGCYGAGRDFAWLADPDTDWHWKIQPICIYGPMNMVFPDLDNNSCIM
jgi:hypothetical protein